MKANEIANTWKEPRVRFNSGWALDCGGIPSADGTVAEGLLTLSLTSPGCIPRPVVGTSPEPNPPRRWALSSDRLVRRRAVDGTERVNGVALREAVSPHRHQDSR